MGICIELNDFPYLQNLSLIVLWYYDVRKYIITMEVLITTNFYYVIENRFIEMMSEDKMQK